MEFHQLRRNNRKVRHIEWFMEWLEVLDLPNDGEVHLVTGKLAYGIDIRIAEAIENRDVRRGAKFFSRIEECRRNICPNILDHRSNHTWHFELEARVLMLLCCLEEREYVLGVAHVVTSSAHSRPHAPRDHLHSARADRALS